MQICSVKQLQNLYKDHGHFILFLESLSSFDELRQNRFPFATKANSKYNLIDNRQFDSTLYQPMTNIKLARDVILCHTISSSSRKKKYEIKFTIQCIYQILYAVRQLGRDMSDNCTGERKESTCMAYLTIKLELCIVKTVCDCHQCMLPLD